jgi:hypothetical protein
MSIRKPLNLQDDFAAGTFAYSVTELGALPMFNLCRLYDQMITQPILGSSALFLGGIPVCLGAGAREPKPETQAVMSVANENSHL